MQADASDINVTASDTGFAQRDRRLANIVESAPQSKQAQGFTFVESAKRFCISKLGIAVFAFVTTFVLLLFLQPPYVQKKSSDDEFGQRHIKFGIIGAISFLSAVVVLLIPMLIVKRKEV
jgi:hypothetical protein